MPVRLVDALREMLTGWQTDLSDPWQTFFDGTELGFEACDHQLMLEFWEPIFPSRRDRPFPGAPKDAHVFRAFDDIQPDDVRCVLLGQDPYPASDFATGRAFEAGNIVAWRELDKMFSKSVRAFMQLICAARTGRPDYAHSFDDWPRLLADIESGSIDLEPASELAGRWVNDGVLLINSSLTLSRFSVDSDPHQSRGHLPVWRPLILKILEGLAKSQRPIVFMAFGDVAMDCLRLSGLDQSKPAAKIIRRPHPADAEALLSLENPFLACNRLLEAMGERPIAW